MYLINTKLFMCLYALFFIKPIEAVQNCGLSDYMLNYNNQYQEYRELRDLYIEFTDWREQHNKGYSDNCELKQGFRNWRYNKQLIDEHNAENKSYDLELNKFADILWHTKFNKISNKEMKAQQFKKPSIMLGDYSNLPKAVDWRLKGYVTPVKNQGQCGSCWTFSTTGAIEGLLAKSGEGLVSLSESQIVDCDKAGNGCNGGTMDLGFEYVQQNGLETETDYPYIASDATCEYNEKKALYKIGGHVDVKGGEMGLQRAVAEEGPVSVAIDASHHTFQLYSGGVYEDKDCSETQLDHGVLVVGYNTTMDGKDYWIVKNSWGENWGNQGYIYMVRNSGNNCGIATTPSYPTI